MGGGVGVWRMVGRGRKEKDLMVGQISFYVFCCCVVRMDGFVQNRINEFVQRQFGFFSRFYDLATPPSQHVMSGGTCRMVGPIPRGSSSEDKTRPWPKCWGRTKHRPLGLASRQARHSRSVDLSPCEGDP